MKPVAPLFLDKNLQEKFDKNGFVAFPLLTSAQTDELIALYKETEALHIKKDSLHCNTTDTLNPELIQKVDTKIKALCVPEIEKVMSNFRPLVSCFHIKKPGKGSATEIHQDYTFVDESKFVSANVWIALQDIDEKNGNLYFIPGSNRIKSLRVVKTTPSYYADFKDQLDVMAVQVPLKKGEAVIINNATIHGATDNLSNDLRLAAALLICSKPAEWVVYYKNADMPVNQVEKYLLDIEGLTIMHREGRPDSKCFQETISYDFPNLTYREFFSEISPSLNLRNYYWRRVKNIFTKKI